MKSAVRMGTLKDNTGKDEQIWICGHLLKLLPTHQLINLPINEMNQFTKDCEPQDVATT